MDFRRVNFIEWRILTGDLYRTGNYRFESDEDGNSVLVDKKSKEIVAYRRYLIKKGVTESYISQ